MYKVYLLLLMTFTQIVIQFTQCTTIHNIAILHKIAINMMQNNKSNRVIILHNNNNNNNSKHLQCIKTWNRMNTEPWDQVLKVQKWECRCTYLIGYQGHGWDTRVLAIGWCLGVPLMLRLGLRLSQMMADDQVVPLAPLRLSVIIPNKAMPWALIVTSGGKNRYCSLCEWYS